MAALAPTPGSLSAACQQQGFTAAMPAGRQDAHRATDADESGQIAACRLLQVYGSWKGDVFFFFLFASTLPCKLRPVCVSAHRCVRRVCLSVCQCVFSEQIHVFVDRLN